MQMKIKHQNAKTEIHVRKTLTRILNIEKYSRANNDWDWKFEVCCFSCPTLSSALNIMCYLQVATIYCLKFTL